MFFKMSDMYALGPDLSCTVLGWLVFQGGVFVGMVGRGSCCEALRGR